MNDYYMTDSTSTEKRYRNLSRFENNDKKNSDNIPLQLYKTRSKPSINEDEVPDDDICIGTILQRSATVRTDESKKEEKPSEEDTELLLAMQRAWAVLDADHDQPVVKVEESTGNTSDQDDDKKEQEDDKPIQDITHMVSTSRIQTVPLKTLTTRIYIDDAKNHKVVQLTNLLTTAMVVQYLKKKGLLDNSDDWTLFEIDNDHGIERPFREWEIVLDVLSAWDLDANNALLVKRYSYHYTLTVDSILQKKVSPMHGWLSIEYKKGKWQKRYCFIKDNTIFHVKDNKSTATSTLCHLATYDVYTLLQPLKISPTPFVFAIRAQDKSSVFEKEGDYMRFLAVETQEEMEDWVLSIRYTKSNIQYQHYPNRVMNPLAPISLETAVDDSYSSSSTSLRRHKSLKETTHTRSEDHIKHPTPFISPSTTALSRSESTRRAADEKRPLARTRGLYRNATVSSPSPSHELVNEGPLIDCFDKPTFAKGSLLAKDDPAEHPRYHHEEANTNTLIQIDDRIQFAKGSLLDQKENKIIRSKSVREAPTNNPLEESSSSSRRHVSLRRKPTRKSHHDVPLPNHTPVGSLPASTSNTNVPSTNTLLRLDDSPEQFHSRELHERHVKPLLNFNEKRSLRK